MSLLLFRHHCCLFIPFYDYIMTHHSLANIRTSILYPYCWLPTIQHRTPHQSHHLDPQEREIQQQISTQHFLGGDPTSAHGVVVLVGADVFVGDVLLVVDSVLVVAFVVVLVVIFGLLIVTVCPRDDRFVFVLGQKSQGRWEKLHITMCVWYLIS